MIRKIFPSLLLSSLLFVNLGAEEPAPAAPAILESQESEVSDADLSDKEAEKIAVISESFGHIIAKHIESLGVDFDLTRLVKGLQDAGEGKNPPMNDVECIEAITKARQQAFDDLATANLEKATAFMQENVKQTNISVMEDGKLHIRIDQEGEGPAVQDGNMPVIRYTGKFIDGSVFGASKEDDLVVLDETIPGFGKGLVGMKEGEKRTLYIHPDLAYGTMGHLPPNSLLIFEIELVKANAEPAKEIAAPAIDKKEALTEEKTTSSTASQQETATLEASPQVEMK